MLPAPPTAAASQIDGFITTRHIYIYIHIQSVLLEYVDIRERDTNRGNGVPKRQERVLHGRRIIRTIGLRNGAFSSVLIPCDAYVRMCECVRVCTCVCVHVCVCIGDLYCI